MYDVYCILYTVYSYTSSLHLQHYITRKNIRPLSHKLELHFDFSL